MSKDEKLNFDLLPESAELIDLIHRVNAILMWKREQDLDNLELWQEAFKEAEKIKEGFDIYGD